VQLRGTARSLAPEVRDLLEKRLPVVVESTATAYGARAKLTYKRGYPVLVNHDKQTEFAASVAGQIAGQDKVDTGLPPMMGAEDFSFMLNARPGAFIWIGNGASAGLHHPSYNFNDEAIPFGTSDLTGRVRRGSVSGRAAGLLPARRCGAGPEAGA
jgi:hippurate hydrolase